MKRRALMLINQDHVIARIADEVKKRRESAEVRIKQLQDEADALVKEVQDQDDLARKEIHDRIDEIGVVVFNKKKHLVEVSPEEGVVWLIQKKQCDCPVCTGQFVMVPVRPQ